MTATAPTRDVLTSGTVLVTVIPDPHWRHVQLVGFGREFHARYTYRLERVENANGRGFNLFLHTLTERKNREPEFVYTGTVHPHLGVLRPTAKSAFPTTATRFVIADRVLRALFTGRVGEIERAGWAVTVEVVKELEGRF